MTTEETIMTDLEFMRTWTPEDYKLYAEWLTIMGIRNSAPDYDQACANEWMETVWVKQIRPTEVGQD